MRRSLLLLFLFPSFLFSQDNKYSDVDPLIATGSMIDAMTALNKLKADHAADTLDSEYWLRISKASYTFFKYEDAKKAISRAVALKPAVAAYHFENGLLLNRIGETDAALGPMNVATTLNPTGEYYYWRGIVQQQLENNVAAESDYTKALELKFEAAGLYNNLAIILLTNEKPEEALKVIDKSIENDPDFAQAYGARSKIHIMLLNIDSACIDMKRARRKGYNKTLDIPDSICKGTREQRLRYCAEVIILNNTYKQAIVAYDELIANERPKGDYFLNRGFCYYKIGEYGKAEKDYLQAIPYYLGKDGEDLLYDNISILYYDMADFTKSIDYSSKRITLNPNNHVPYIDRGLCYRKLKRYKEAEKDFNRSLELKPDFFRAYGYRSYLWLERGQYQKAYDDSNKSVQLNPEYGYGYLIRGQVKKELGISDYCLDLYAAKKYGMKEEAEESIKALCK